MAFKKYFFEELGIGESQLVEIIERDDGSGINNVAVVRQSVVRIQKKTGRRFRTKTTTAGIYVTRIL